MTNYYLCASDNKGVEDTSSTKEDDTRTHRVVEFRFTAGEVTSPQVRSFCLDLPRFAQIYPYLPIFAQICPRSAQEGPERSRETQLAPLRVGSGSTFVSESPRLCLLIGSAVPGRLPGTPQSPVTGGGGGGGRVAPPPPPPPQTSSITAIRPALTANDRHIVLICVI